MTKQKNAEQLVRDALALLEGAAPLADLSSAAVSMEDLSEVKRMLTEAADRASETDDSVADAAANHFWDVFEDIETTDEIADAGPNADAAFRQMVRTLVGKRWRAAKRGPMNTILWREPEPEPPPPPTNGNGGR